MLFARKLKNNFAVGAKCNGEMRQGEDKKTRSERIGW